MAGKLDSAETDSSLSPVANDLIEQVEGKAEVVPPANSKKRKAATTTTTASVTTKRTKKAPVAATDNDGEAHLTDTKESPHPKRRAVKKVKVEEHVVDEEVKVEADRNGATKVTTRKKITTTRKKKPVDTAPLAGRTKDTNLRVGAHVSIAGG